MKPEDKVQTPILQFLKSKNAWHFKHAAGANKKGIPDIICCYGGYFISIEVKRQEKSKARVDVQQKVNANHIAQNGGIAIITNDVQFVERVFDIIDHPDTYHKNDIKDTLLVNCGLGVGNKPVVYSNTNYFGIWNDILLQMVGD